MLTFLQLPQELRDRIYREHYKSAAIVVRWDPYLRSSASMGLVFDPLPGLNIELVCRNIYKDARSVRDACWPRIMTVTRSIMDNLDSTRLDMVFGALVKGGDRFSWLCDRIEKVFALDILCKYPSGDSCFSWPNLLLAMPRLCYFSFSTWKNLPIQNKDDARRLLLSVDRGEHDEYLLESVHRFGVGDLPVELRRNARRDWSVLLNLALRFKAEDGSNWFQRVRTVRYFQLHRPPRDDHDLLFRIADFQLNRLSRLTSARWLRDPGKRLSMMWIYCQM